ncbi:hypothetical protein BH11PSE7_BH11PSE7_28580 [soil metagenome]
MVWLLLLALLLPLAQTVASVHLLSHFKLEQASAPASHSSPGAEHCDLCLNAAVLTTGAPLVQSFAAALNMLPQSVAIHAAPVTFFGACVIVYESRAPPSLQV